MSPLSYSSVNGTVKKSYVKKLFFKQKKKIQAVHNMNQCRNMSMNFFIHIKTHVNPHRFLNFLKTSIEFFRCFIIFKTIIPQH